MKFKLAGLAALSSLMALAVSGCARFLVPAGGEQPAPVVEASAAAPTNAPAAGALPCAHDVGAMQLFTDETHGFCVLIPEGFTISRPNDSEVAAFLGPMPAKSGVAPLGWIVVADAQGRSAAESAAPVIAEAEGMGIAVKQQSITLGGEKAVVADGLPGQDVTRKVFVVHGGSLYELSFTPSDPNYDAYASMQSLYDAMIGSFAFLR